MLLDSAGTFTWKPGYDIADRIQTVKTIPLLLEVHNQFGESATQSIDLKVRHVNRPPVIGELPPFYVRYRTQNVYKMDPSAIKDEDNDPIVFIPISDQMPEGSKLSSQGRNDLDAVVEPVQ